MRFTGLTLIALLAFALGGCRDRHAAPGNLSSPNRGEEVSARGSYALAYVGNDQASDRVIREAQKLVRKAPEEGALHAGLAQAFLRAKRATGDGALMAYAADALAAARALSPGHPDVLVTQILLYQEDHDFQKARDAARKLIAAQPGESTGHLLLGDALLELGDYRGALDAYQKGLDLRPGLPAYSRAAYVNWLHNDFEGAVEFVEQALDAASTADPEPAAWVFVDFARMLWAKGELDAVMRATNRALQLVPNYAPALSMRARALAALSQPRDALATVESALDQRVSSEDLLFAAELHEQAGEPDKARQALRRAEKLAGHDPLPLALYYARRGVQVERAVELARGAVAKRANIFSHNVLAITLSRAGDQEGARQAIEKAMALGTPEPTFRLHRALIELNDGNLARARELVAGAKKLNPHSDPLLMAELDRRLEVSL